jgi:hypothetical protein
MPRERKKFYQLTSTDYEISGNVFRAWRGEDDRLVVVLDETIDEYKPYVLLVMDSYENRKWDDVLSNDFKLDLEDVRPKKENKYQKLDIEYGGLEFYAHLIDAYESGQDTTDALIKLYDFRDAAVRRAATERLVAATDIIAQSAKTARIAERTITNLTQKIKKLKEDLEYRRSEVGREPPKETASRILKIESQIDRTEEKNTRAKKRLDNAVRRGDAARDDADVARDILSRRRPVLKSADTPQKIVDDAPSFTNLYQEEIQKNEEVSEETTVTEEVVKTTDNSEPRATLPVPDYETQSEPQENKMPDTPETEEVKPLFDENPEILDEEIAFKPVAFEDIKPEPTANPVDNHTADVVKQEKIETVETTEIHEVPVTQPLSFSENNSSASDYAEATDYQEPEPVLNKIQSVKESTGADMDRTGQLNNTQYANTTPAAPVTQNTTRPASYGTRPISPITGETTAVKPVGSAGNSRPTVFYYFLLILLIALSIFTLWLYQKENNKKPMPFADKTIQTEPIKQPDVIGGTKVVTVEPEPEPEPIVEPEPEPIIEPEPPEPPEPIIEPEPINVIYPNPADVMVAAEPEVPEVESEESVLARKQAYGVSRESQGIYVPDVIFEDDVISVPVVAPNYVDEEELYYQDGGDEEYYQEDQIYYDEPQPMPYDEYESDEGYIDEADEGFIMEDSGGRDYLSIHDGGQYSVGYHEEIY